jgi:hypothetical protein
VTAPVPFTAVPAAWNAGAGGPDAEIAVAAERNAICAWVAVAARSAASAKRAYRNRLMDARISSLA